MHQRGLAAVPLAAVTLCTAVCGGCSSGTKTTGRAGSSSAAAQSAMTSASPSPRALGAKWYVVDPAGGKAEGD